MTCLIHSVAHCIRRTRVAVHIVRAVVVMVCVDPSPLTGCLLFVVRGSTHGLAPAIAEHVALLVDLTTSFGGPEQPECDTLAYSTSQYVEWTRVAVHTVRSVVVMSAWRLM